MDQVEALEPVEHDVSLRLDTTDKNEAPKVIREFRIFAAHTKEQRMNLVGEFNSRLFDEAVDMTVHKLRARLGEDLA